MAVIMIQSFSLMCFCMLLCVSCANLINRLERSIQSNSLKAPETYKVGNLTCLMCQPGTRLISDCVIENHSATCQSCEDGFFQKGYTRATSCQECKTACLVNFIVNKTCSAVTDNECICKDGYHYLDLGGDGEGKCLPNKPCPAGEGIVIYGPSSRQKAKCEDCPEGTFSDQNSSTQRCQNFTKCVNGTVQERPGSRTQDRTCIPDPGSGGGNNAGAIAGIVVGVILIIVIIVAVVVVLWRKQKLCFRKERETQTARLDGKEMRPLEEKSSSTERNGDQPNGVHQYRNVPNESPGTKSRVGPRIDSTELAKFLSINLLSNKQNMRFCLRDIIGDTGQDPNAILNEMEENYPRDVKEVLYRSVIKWTEVAARNVKADNVLNCLIRHNYGEAAEKFKEKFKDVLSLEEDHDEGRGE